MAKINPDATKLIDLYIEKLPDFSKEICIQLREIIHLSNNNVIEDWKWRIPIFQLKDMVCGFAGFKKHVTLTFFNGAAIEDKNHLFSDDCSAKNSRGIKFYSINEVNTKLLKHYLKEAFLLSEKGIEKSKTKEKIVIPDLLKNALAKNSRAKENFDNMAYTYRKEYALYIANAKRETTKLNRLKKVISNLENNIKMHEQYQ